MASQKGRPGGKRVKRVGITWQKGVELLLAVALVGVTLWSAQISRDMANTMLNSYHLENRPYLGSENLAFAWAPRENQTPQVHPGIIIVNSGKVPAQYHVRNLTGNWEETPLVGTPGFKPDPGQVQAGAKVTFLFAWAALASPPKNPSSGRMHAEFDYWAPSDPTTRHVDLELEYRVFLTQNSQPAYWELNYLTQRDS